MREIGIRELKASLSETLRAVARGEQVRVTLRGEPVADIVPAGRTVTADDRIRELVAQGRLTPATKPMPPPPPLVKAKRSATDIILAERDEER